jgi:hypothetical protein
MADFRYSSWGSNYRLLHALAMYRRSLAPPSKGSDLLPSLDELGVEPPRNTGYAWSRWWRRSQMTIPGSAPAAPPTSSPPVSEAHIDEPAPTDTRYAKTLRLSSDQLVSVANSSFADCRNNWTSRSAQTRYNSRYRPPTLAWRCALPVYSCGKKQTRLSFRTSMEPLPSRLLNGLGLTADPMLWAMYTQPLVGTGPISGSQNCTRILPTTVTECCT